MKNRIDFEEIQTALWSLTMGLIGWIIPIFIIGGVITLVVTGAIQLVRWIVSE